MILIFYIEKFSKIMLFVIFVCGPEHFPANLIENMLLNINVVLSCT
jgi:hypothetical protein